MEQSPPLLVLTPERDHAPENMLAGRQVLNDHLEPPFFDYSNEFEIGDRHRQFFPASMPAAALPFIGRLNSLHCAAKAQDFRGSGQKFEPHELVATIPPSVPVFE